MPSTILPHPHLQTYPESCSPFSHYASSPFGHSFFPTYNPSLFLVTEFLHLLALQNLRPFFLTSERASSFIFQVSNQMSPASGKVLLTTSSKVVKHFSLPSWIGFTTSP